MEPFRRAGRIAAALCVASCMLGTGEAVGFDLTITTSNSTPTLNEEFDVTVWVTGASPFMGWQAFLSFDTDLLQVTNQAVGSLPGPGFFVPDGDPTDGGVGAGGSDFAYSIPVSAADARAPTARTHRSAEHGVIERAMSFPLSPLGAADSVYSRGRAPAGEGDPFTPSTMSHSQTKKARAFRPRSFHVPTLAGANESVMMSDP